MKKSISIRDEFIKLGQAMKLAGLVDSGVDAKYAIEEGSVKVNGEIDLRRGRKLYNGDVFTFKGDEVTVVSKISI
jgi:ribosome-associated protein